jgi:hypothetical protein
MKLEDLKPAWNDEIERSAHWENADMNAIVDDVTKINHAVQLRDFWMILALAFAATVNVLFGWLARPQVDWLSRLGIIAFVLGTAAVCVALFRARRSGRTDDWTLRSRVEIEIERLEKQRRLLNRLVAWFLMPMLIAVNLSALGGYHARTGTYLPNAPWWALCVVSGALLGLTYWLVRREVKRKWEPLLTRLHRVLVDLSGVRENDA